jgi:hypothetical protein
MLTNLRCREPIHEQRLAAPSAQRDQRREHKYGHEPIRPGEAAVPSARRSVRRRTRDRIAPAHAI